MTNDNVFASGKVTKEVWATLLQDKGTSEKDDIPANTYCRSKIPGVGPKGHEVYYFDLTSLAIDILSNMKLENDLGRGWSKVPKNKTDAKIKLVQVIISKRQIIEDKYHLDQTMVMIMRSTMWRAARPVNILDHNDHVRVFGIVMSIPENKEIFGRLANGPSGRHQIDDVTFHPKQIFQDIALSFNNELFFIRLPPDAYELTSIEDIDPNDMCRIRITPNCKFKMNLHPKYISTY